MNRIWMFLLMIFGIIIADQMTKGTIQNYFLYGESLPIVEGFFNLTYVKNPGAAFGMGANAHPIIRQIFFLFLPVVACFWLCALIWKVRHQSLRLGFAYSLILAGAIGNLIDRFSLGYVVDFLDFHYQGHHFPAFNIADSSISVAAGILILDFVIELRKDLKKHQQEKLMSKEK